MHIRQKPKKNEVISSTNTTTPAETKPNADIRVVKAKGAKVGAVKTEMGIVIPEKEWIQDGVWLVLGSGICSPGIISQQDNVRLMPSKVICVEIDETAREVAEFANPSTSTFPGIDHHFYDVNAITPEWIRDNASSITRVCISMPCKDMTTLTLLVHTLQVD